MRKAAEGQGQAVRRQRKVKDSAAPHQVGVHEHLGVCEHGGHGEEKEVGQREEHELDHPTCMSPGIQSQDTSSYKTPRVVF
jgi:hypothetical protein